MYQKLKNLIFRIIPRSFFLRFEKLIRFLISLLYTGNKVHCPICENSFSKLIENNDELLCPRCGSLGRQRRLWLLLCDDLKFDTNARILHFSPARVLQNKLRKQYPGYITTDYENEFPADKHYDITNIPEPDNSFDGIICYHVLEHIPDDKKAMDELYRILSPNGKLIVQTPFKDGKIYEDESVNTPELRQEHFGQEDHVRIYSVEGLNLRLSDAGFRNEILEFNDQHMNKYGLKAGEKIIICIK